MKLSEHVYALPITADLWNGPMTIYPALILDEVHGATLVDAGVPGMQADFETALGSIGVKLSDVRRIIITHHDLDHIGSLPALVAATGADVLTSGGEVPYVQGEKPGQKQPSPEAIASMPPEARARFANPPKAAVTRILNDNELLEIAGGVRVISTPGHTVGHLSLFVESDGLLITGDAMTSEAGQLRFPMARATPDMPLALESLKRLAALPVRAVLTYHGGLVSREAAQQLQRLSAEADHQA